MSNMSDRFGDISTLRAEKEAKDNPPNFDVGQGIGDDWDLSEDSNSSLTSDAFLGSDFNNSAGGINSLPNQQVQQPLGTPNSQGVNTEFEDKIFEVLILAGKGIFICTKELFKGIEEGLKNNNAFYWSCYGKKLMIVGGIISIISVIMCIFGLVTRFFGNSFWGLIGGLLTVSVGLTVFVMNYEKGNEVRVSLGLGDTTQTPTEEAIDIYDDYSNTSSSSEEDEDSGWGDGWDDDFEEEYEDEEDDLDSSDLWGKLDEIEESMETTPIVTDEPINVEEKINSIREIEPHTQTRQYLFEEYSKILPYYNPTFFDLKPISENSDEFIVFDKVLSDASIQVGTKEDSIPELLELCENQFIIQIVASRPSGLKEQDIAVEVANRYSKDDHGRIIHEGVYATVDSVGGNFIINLFKGQNSIITLADTYKSVKDFVLDVNVKKPIVIGVNELGKVWSFDAEEIYSYIFSGIQRSGKSWCVVSLITQLVMYNSPKEVQFEAFDTKNESSDFYRINKILPHFKRFEGTKQGILSRLRYITHQESKRRVALLKEHDVINIVDFKAKYPDIELPYLYIIIDEMTGLMQSEFTKEEANEFRGLLNTIVTKYPNTGLRVILIPHRVVNEIIPKTTYTNVSFIACVRSDMNELSTVLNVTKKTFPYDLPSIGDMAIKSGVINRGKPVFSHGIAITTTNASNIDVYKYIGKIWEMLEPEEKKEEEVKKVEEYKGHILEGVDELDDESFLYEEESINKEEEESESTEEQGVTDEEDFWNDMGI